MTTAKSFDGREISYDEMIEEGLKYSFYFSRAERERFAEMSEDEAHGIAVRELGDLDTAGRRVYLHFTENNKFINM